MPARFLTIPPEGPCTPGEGDLWHERELILGTDQTSVILCRHPALTPRMFVLHIDDWGRTKARPLNRRAWALYGGSPVYGPAILHRDDDQPLDLELVSWITGPDFPSAAAQEAMDLFLDANPDAPRE